MVQVYSGNFDAKWRTGPGAVAILVDGENISHDAAVPLMPRIAMLGVPTILRAYCDRLNANGWDRDPRFQVTYLDRLAGKNSADIRLVIDAMDIAHARTVHAVALLSTDRDFAPLAHRLRAMGLWVLGAGRVETSDLFRSACSEFHVLPSPKPRDVPAAQAVAPPREPAPDPAQPVASAPVDIDAAIHRVCRKHGGKGARIPLMTLGIAMPRDEGVQRKDCMAPTWRSYLKSKPDLYRLEGEGQGSTVALIRPQRFGA